MAACTTGVRTRYSPSSPLPLIPCSATREAHRTPLAHLRARPSRRAVVLPGLLLLTSPFPCVDTPCHSSTINISIIKSISMPNTPTYILYHGRNTGKDKDGKKIWTRIGAAWPNKSGKGYNLSWDYLPLGDGLTVMLPYDKDSGEISPPMI